jgi:hypothetical protein
MLAIIALASQYGRYGYRRIKSLLDEAGWKVGCSDEFAAVNITRADFHGEWNYTISPNNRSDRADDS